MQSAVLATPRPFGDTSLALLFGGAAHLLARSVPPGRRWRIGTKPPAAPGASVEPRRVVAAARRHVRPSAESGHLSSSRRSGPSFLHEGATR